jgi:hypothetical protein
MDANTFVEHLKIIKNAEINSGIFLWARIREPTKILPAITSPTLNTTEIASQNSNSVSIKEMTGSRL